MNHEIDYKILSYWVLAALTIMGISYGVISFLNQNQNQDLDTDYTLILEDKQLNPNQLSRVQFVKGNSSIEDAEIFVGGVYIGETNSEGRISYRSPKKDFNITASTGNKSVTQTVEVVKEDNERSQEKVDGDGQEESQDQEDSQNETKEVKNPDNSTDESSQTTFTGFKLESDPVANELNRLTAFKEDNRVSNAEVKLNKEIIGETTPGGSLSFEVPNNQAMILKTSDISTKFNISGYSEEKGPIRGKIDPSFEINGMKYEAEQILLNASASESENSVESYNWTIQHSNFVDRLQGQTAQYTIPSEGDYNITLKITDSYGFSSDRTQFIGAEPEYSGATIYLSEPGPGDVVEAERDFEFQVENAREGQEANIMIGGTEEASVVLAPGLNIYDQDSSITVPIHSEGDLDYWIEVEDEGGKWESDEREITNIREYGEFGSYTVSPEDGLSTSDPVDFVFDLNVTEPTEITISGSSEEYQFRNQTTVPSSKEQYAYSEDLPQGEYEWSASISVADTSETESISKRDLSINE